MTWRELLQLAFDTYNVVYSLAACVP